MTFLYNFFIQVFQAILPFLGLFFKRLKVFYQERKNTRHSLRTFLQQNKNPIIWVHVASLGEYEQVVPVVQQLKSHFKNHKIVFSFFSDSGYRIKKHKSIGDFETYLPLDTPKNAKNFVKSLNPEFAIFVKYDIWPNYINQLNKNNTKTFLIAARFRPKQIYFKSYGGFFRKALKGFDYIFVQDQSSGKLLNSIDISQWKISGDTRYDRVSLQLEHNNQLDFMNAFLGDSTCMVCGSTWQQGENVLLPTINDKSINLKYVIAPHQIHDKTIEELRAKIKKPNIKYTEISNQDLSQYEVLILDTVGLLNKVYSYAEIAYVGGGFGNSGLHNILEPAAFGMPILIGPNHKKFPEAKALEQNGGLYVIENAEKLHLKIKKLTESDELKNKMAEASKTFISSQKGATDISVNGILEKLRENN